MRRNCTSGNLLFNLKPFFFSFLEMGWFICMCLLNRGRTRNGKKEKEGRLIIECDTKIINMLKRSGIFCFPCHFISVFNVSVFFVSVSLIIFVGLQSLHIMRG